MSRRGALTVEVTVSSFSSYVAFLEGYARALVAAETPLGPRPHLAARGDPLGARRDPLRAATDAARRASPSRFPTCGPSATSRGWRRRSSRCRRGSPRRGGRKVVVALDEFQAIAGFNGGSVEHALRAAVQHQREVGYVFAGSEPSLMERMLGAEAAVLQGRAGDAAREDSRRTSSPRSSTRASADRASAPSRDSAPRSSISPATCRTTCSGWRTKPGTTCGRPAAAPRDARRSAPGAHAAARRAADDVRGGVAAADARAARGAARGRARGRPRAAVGRRARRATGSAAPSTVQAALAALLREDVDRPRRRPLRRRRLAAREWVARQTF